MVDVSFSISFAFIEEIYNALYNEISSLESIDCIIIGIFSVKWQLATGYVYG